MNSRKKVMLLLLIILGVIVLRIPNLAEPVWNIDESIYLTIGNSILSGKKLYTDIYDNKPPLLYLVAAASGGNIFAYKFILFILGIALVYVFYRLTKVWFLDFNTRYISTAFFALFISTPIFEGNILNAEILFILPLMLAFIAFFSYNRWYLSGILIGIAGLVKIPALADGLVIFGYIVAYQREDSIKRLLKFTLGIVTPFIISFIYFWLVGSLPDYLKSVFTNNLSYIQAYIPPHILGLEKLPIRLLILLIIVVGLYIYSKKIDKRLFIIVLWFFSSLFGALISSRPYTHYLVQVLPSLCILFGYYLSYPFNKKIIPGILIGIFLFVFIKFRFFEQQVTSYYQNYISYTVGAESKNQYISWFGTDVLQNYQLAQEINMVHLTSSNIFVLADNPSLYVLTRTIPPIKYFLAYHIVEQNEVVPMFTKAAQDSPDLIIVENPYYHLPGLHLLFKGNYSLLADTGLNRIYVLSTVAYKFENKYGRPEGRPSSSSYLIVNSRRI